MSEKILKFIELVFDYPEYPIDIKIQRGYSRVKLMQYISEKNFCSESEMIFTFDEIEKMDLEDEKLLPIILANFK